MTLMPVSKISVGRLQLLEGGGRPVDGPALDVGRSGSPSSMGSPSRLKSRPSVAWPTGTVMGCAGVDDLHAAGEAVGGVHGHGAHLVVAQVLLHLGDQVDVPDAARRRRSRGRCRWPAASSGELHVEHRPDDLNDLAFVHRFSTPLLTCRACVGSRSGSGSSDSASAPATTSRISWVMDDCRARFIARVSCRSSPRRSRTRCAWPSCARRARWRSPPGSPGRSVIST